MQETSKKKLRRGNDTMLWGVCNGLSDFFGFDTTLVRFLFVLATLFSIGGSIIVYVALAVLMPKAETDVTQ